jgi:hypothetical protein
VAQLVIKSQRFSFISEDVKSLLIGALITGGGALLTYLSENISKVSFGDWTPAVVVVASLLINTVRKFISTSKYAK